MDSPKLSLSFESSDDDSFDDSSDDSYSFFSSSDSEDDLNVKQVFKPLERRRFNSLDLIFRFLAFIVLLLLLAAVALTWISRIGPNASSSSSSSSSSVLTIIKVNELEGDSNSGLKLFGFYNKSPPLHLHVVANRYESLVSYYKDNVCYVNKGSSYNEPRGTRRSSMYDDEHGVIALSWNLTNR
ncbi:unnamed protein product [Cochlearia groenlandica]